MNFYHKLFITFILVGKTTVSLNCVFANEENLSTPYTKKPGKVFTPLTWRALCMHGSPVWPCLSKAQHIALQLKGDGVSVQESAGV